MTRPVVSLSVAFALAPGMGLLVEPFSPDRAEPLHAAAGQESVTEIEPFTIDIPDAALVDLRERLARARLPDEPEGVGWQLGMNQAYLKQLIEYWRDEFDWRAQERRLNALEQFKTRIDGLDIHFVHRRSPETGRLAADPDPRLAGHVRRVRQGHRTPDRSGRPRRAGGGRVPRRGPVHPRLRLLGPAASPGLRARPDRRESSRS